IRERVEWHGREIIDQMKAEQHNVIFLVPHGWAVDIPAMLLRDPARIRERVEWHGREIIDQMKAEQHNVIFLVPHGWAVDI
ncbi:hypothetical protein HZD82_22970, partial [Pantoea agglomerans]|uniref:LpxL/LpxP family acyltransferase n=1 Tax=Enterobacter agglomerans TaxID=549 RepID=UPI003F6DC12C|nr:hypothetical protein [Pantoea agglomerans]